MMNDKRWGTLRDELIYLSMNHADGVEEMHEPAYYLGLMHQVERKNAKRNCPECEESADGHCTPCQKAGI